jgi:hypothetical protein
MIGYSNLGQLILTNKRSAVAYGNLSKLIPTNKESAVACGNLSKQDIDYTSYATD